MGKLTTVSPFVDPDQELYWIMHRPRFWDEGPGSRGERFLIGFCHTEGTWEKHQESYAREKGSPGFHSSLRRLDRLRTAHGLPVPKGPGRRHAQDPHS